MQNLWATKGMEVVWSLQCKCLFDNIIARKNNSLMESTWMPNALDRSRKLPVRFSGIMQGFKSTGGESTCRRPPVSSPLPEISGISGLSLPRFPPARLVRCWMLSVQRGQVVANTPWQSPLLLMLYTLQRTNTENSKQIFPE